ncbi:MAG: FecR domain-containing protein [Myxococcota bacterium]
MKQVSCPRAFEVEALRNGRLSGTERNSFERHLALCSECAQEAAELEALGQALHACHPAQRDELHLRRERTRLLAAFDRAPAEPRPIFARRWLPTALVAGCALLFAFWRLRAPVPSIAKFNAVVHAADGARWSRTQQGERETIVLAQGSLWISVRHGQAPASLRVQLPDGELEDIGTTFSVTVADGRTERVSVEEGQVILRLRSGAPVALTGGQSWSSTKVTASTLDVAPPTADSKVAPELEAGKPSKAEPKTVANTRSTAPAPSASASASGVNLDASSDFRAALAAFNQGDNTEAARRFSQFIGRHPRDSRAEDAAYLRVLALKRSGDHGAMRAAAQEYLRRYPAAFRREEVERLLR